MTETAAPATPRRVIQQGHGLLDHTLSADDTRKVLRALRIARKVEQERLEKIQRHDAASLAARIVQQDIDTLSRIHDQMETTFNTVPGRLPPEKG